jgi:homoserine kinase
MGRVKVRIPATTANLGPGFDALGLALSLYNVVEMEEGKGGLSIRIDGEGQDSLPRNEDNIVYRASAQAFREVGYKVRGIRIKLTNDIPVARGLGSSAASIVGGLAAANALSGNRLPTEGILKLALGLEGHPDNIISAMVGGFTISCIADGEARYIKLPAAEGFKVVVAIPDFALSTEEARKKLPRTVSFQDAAFNLGRSSFLVAALATSRLDMLKIAMEDRLHQPYRASLVPGLKDVLAAAVEAGAWGAALSGAGPSVVAFADRGAEAVGERMVGAFSKHGVVSTAKVLEVDKEGVRVQLHST